MALVRRHDSPWAQEVWALRVGLVVAAAVAVWAPEVEFGGSGRARVLVLDRSRSVASSRSQRSRALRGALADLGKDDRVALILVGARAEVAHRWLNPSKSAAALSDALARPSDPWGSDLSDALNLAGQLLGGQDLPGEVLLISDGHDTGGTLLDAAARLGRMGVALHAWAPDVPDLAGARLVGIQASSQAVPGERLPIRVEAQALSTVELTLELELFREGQLLQSFPEYSRSATRGERITRTWISGGLEPGPLVLRARVRTKGRDDAPEDDTFELRLQVGGGPRILSVGVASGLRATPIAAVDLGRALEIGSPDLIVLAEVPASRIAAATPALAAAVRAGTALAVIGVQGAFARGGYAATELEDLLPITCGPGREREHGVSLAVALDASGSMAVPEARSRYLQALDAALPLSLLRDGDRLSVTAFADTADVVHALGAAPDDLLARLARRIPGGATDIGVGLASALRELGGAAEDDELLLILATDSEDSDPSRHEAQLRTFATQLAGREGRALLVHIGAGSVQTLERLAAALRPALDVSVRRVNDAGPALRELVEGELLAARSDVRTGAFPATVTPAGAARRLSVPDRVPAFAAVRVREDDSYSAEVLATVTDPLTGDPPLAVLGRRGLGRTLVLPVPVPTAAPMLRTLVQELLPTRRGAAQLRARRDGRELVFEVIGEDLEIGLSLRGEGLDGTPFELTLTPTGPNRQRGRAPAPTARALHVGVFGKSGERLGGATIPDAAQDELAAKGPDFSLLDAITAGTGGSLLPALPTAKHPLAAPAALTDAKRSLGPFAALVMLLLLVADAAAATIRARWQRSSRPIV